MNESPHKWNKITDSSAKTASRHPSMRDVDPVWVSERDPHEITREETGEIVEATRTWRLLGGPPSTGDDNIYHSFCLGILFVRIRYSNATLPSLNQCDWHSFWHGEHEATRSVYAQYPFLTAVESSTVTPLYRHQISRTDTAADTAWRHMICWCAAPFLTVESAVARLASI